MSNNTQIPSNNSSATDLNPSTVVIDGDQYFITARRDADGRIERIFIENEYGEAVDNFAWSGDYTYGDVVYLWGLSE